MDKFYFSLLSLLITSSILLPLTSQYNINQNITDHSYNKFKLDVPEIIQKYSSKILYVLVVLMEIPDDPHHPSHTVQYYENLFFSLNNPTSVNRYFYNVSYGEVLLEGDILGWYQAENNLNYYGQGTRIPPGQDADPMSLVNESRIHATNEGHNPLNYDLFIVIHSGDGQEYSGNSDDLWSHKYFLSYEDNGWKYLEYTMNHEYVDYKTPSHELGHALYFPDLYDLNYDHEFAGPYAMMDSGDGHFSIWNKYYSKISRPDSAQFLTEEYRLKIDSYDDDIYATVNPIAITEPIGIMWLEIGWNNTGLADPNHGRGWTVSVRENLDFDTFLTKYGVVIAEIQVGPRYAGNIQVSPNFSPPWNVIDSHPETSENKDDAAFSFSDGDVSTYCSGYGWALQLIERYENLSYLIRVTNERNIPDVSIITPSDPVSGIYSLLVKANASSSISSVEISIDYNQWQSCTFDINSNLYTYNWNTTDEREGTHIIRARAKDNALIPYQGYSEYVIIDVDNFNGNILVIDDDLGRSSEKKILSALDDLGLLGTYEIKQTTSLIEAEISSEEMSNYEYILWIGNPSISPLANSHINYNEFKEIKRYLQNSTKEYRSGIIFMSSYTIFDFSNQGLDIHNEIADVFRARSPINFRSASNLIQGREFLIGLPQFTLGNTDTLRANRSSDGEVVHLLPGTISILEDNNPVFPGFSSKGYYVDTGEYKLVNYLFQPEMVPQSILIQLLNETLNFLQLPNNSTLTSSTTTSRVGNQPIGIEPVVIGILAITSIGTAIFILKKVRTNPHKEQSYWLTRNKEK